MICILLMSGAVTASAAGPAPLYGTRETRTPPHADKSPTQGPTPSWCYIARATPRPALQHDPWLVQRPMVARVPRPLVVGLVGRGPGPVG